MRDSWETESDTKLWEFYLQFDRKVLGAFTMWVDDWKGIDHLEIVGAFRDGSVVFTDLTISTEKITTDTPRIPIGAIRQEVIDRVRKVPDYADVASCFERVSETLGLSSPGNILGNTAATMTAASVAP